MGPRVLFQARASGTVKYATNAMKEQVKRLGYPACLVTLEQI
ncbi:hypothetical protein PRUB_a3064 [Pseudoalteromonas rubra]|uniref:Uncharacterized protein n=1 Tax=Pseudoalteromonas rubra TaxID=43658 RepID=A0A8T0CCZ6_9GAMM|nr:hypothetical protein PRUB_a3064 [Pseudoalteromonas rubra]